MGLLLPYFALYLGDHAELRGGEMGVVFAVVPLVGVLAQPFWGLLADRSGRRSGVLVALNLGSAATYWWLGHCESFLEIVLATAALAAFARALIPIALSVTLPALEARPEIFGRVRACGTAGFLVTVVGFPLLLERIGGSGFSRSPDALAWLFPTATGWALLAALAALRLPRQGGAAVRAGRGEWRSLLHNARYMRLLAVAFASFLFLTAPMEFFPLLVTRGRGGDLSAVSVLWLIMLVPEIGLLLFFRAADRLGARVLLTVGVGAGGARWLLSGALASAAWLYPAQALHAVVVVGLMLGGPLYIHAVVPSQLRSTAQALHAAVAVGLGGAASSLIGGQLLERWGTGAPFVAGGIGALALAVALPFWLPALAREASPAPRKRPATPTSPSPGDGGV